MTLKTIVLAVITVWVVGAAWEAGPQTSVPLSVPALQHPVTCPVPYSSPAQLVHPDGLLREANCLDPHHGFEWYCGDPKRALIVSQDGSKAWCERGPE